MEALCFICAPLVPVFCHWNDIFRKCWVWIPIANVYIVSGNCRILSRIVSVKGNAQTLKESARSEGMKPLVTPSVVLGRLFLSFPPPPPWTSTFHVQAPVSSASLLIPPPSTVSTGPLFQTSLWPNSAISVFHCCFVFYTKNTPTLQGKVLDLILFPPKRIKLDRYPRFQPSSGSDNF